MHATRFAMVALAVLTARGSGYAFAQTSADSLKIATYNINWGNPDLKKMVATIRQADAEIVCLQETTRPSESYIRQTLKKTYPHIRFRGHDGRFAAERFGFLSRHPIDKLSFLRPKHALFGAYIAHVKLRDQAVQIVNVHLQPVVLRPGGGLREAFSALAAMEKAHQQEISEIFANIQRDVPTLIVGDFNSTSALLGPTFVRANGFVDSFAHAHKNPDSYATWHWRLKHGRWSLRIDYIFHSPHFTTRDSSIIPSSASDHCLVTSTLLLSKQAQKREEP